MTKSYQKETQVRELRFLFIGAHDGTFNRKQGL